MMFSGTFSRIMLLSLMLHLGACATFTAPDRQSTAPPQPAQSPGPEPVPPEQATLVPHKPASPPASSAWKPLLAKADQAAHQGDYEQALALLERAQRIDPDSAEVYLGMAKTHQMRGNAAQARVMAERGLLYCAAPPQCAALQAYVR